MLSLHLVFVSANQISRFLSEAGSCILFHLWYTLHVGQTKHIVYISTCIARDVTYLPGGQYQ